MSACEEYGPLISAMIDGELSAEKRLGLDQHLQLCTACRQRAQTFEELNRLAATEMPTVSADWPQQVIGRLEADRRHRRRKLVGYATAAAILLSLLALPLFRSSRVARNTPAPVEQNLATTGAADGDLIGTLETLQVVSRQEKRTQETMRRLMSWDLRALKLELKQLNLAPEKLQQLERRIDVLMNRVEQVGQADDEGESI